jgi:hypothetical protein
VVAALWARKVEVRVSHISQKARDMGYAVVILW